MSCRLTVYGGGGHANGIESFFLSVCVCVCAYKPNICCEDPVGGDKRIIFLSVDRPF